MRVRVVILIVLAVLLAAVAMLALWQGVVLSNEANHLFDGSSTPTVADQARANELWSESSTLQQLVTPLATVALLCVIAVLSMQAWNWQSRARRADR